MPELPDLRVTRLSIPSANIKGEATERYSLPPFVDGGAHASIFFDIVDGEDFPDLQGSLHADLAAARIEAVRYSAEVLKEMPERFWNRELWTMSVSDQDRQPLFALQFMAANAAISKPLNSNGRPTVASA